MVSLYLFPESKQTGKRISNYIFTEAVNKLFLKYIKAVIDDTVFGDGGIG